MASPAPERPGKSRHHLTNLVFVVILSLILIVAALVVIGYSFRLTGCFGCSTNSLVSTGPISCGVTNKSCEVVLMNVGNTNAQVVGCSFQSANAPGGPNGTSEAFTITGVLTYKTGGPAITMFIPAGSSETVYCSGYSGWLEAGAPVNGNVQTATGDLDAFSGYWH